MDLQGASPRLVKSIRDFRLDGIFRSGPWDGNLVTVESSRIAASEAGLVEHLRLYAAPPLASAIAGFEGSYRFQYDWSLNE